MKIKYKNTEFELQENFYGEEALITKVYTDVIELNETDNGEYYIFTKDLPARDQLTIKSQIKHIKLKEVSKQNSFRIN